MDYYIQGNAANADKIKSAFESKGIRVPDFRSCMDSSLIYFSLNKEVLAVTIKALELFEDNPDYKELELPKPHYGITNFEPFDKVLVRDRNDEPWRIAFYGYYNEEANYSHFIGTRWSKQCIPFNEETKYLLGTTDMCPEEFINW